MSVTAIDAMTFEAAMAALEQVVGALEKGDVALEQSIALYERGAALKAHCAAKLREAEAKVELIRAAEGRCPRGNHAPALRRKRDTCSTRGRAWLRSPTG